MSEASRNPVPVAEAPRTAAAPRRTPVRAALLVVTGLLLVGGLVLFASAPDPAEQAVEASGALPIEVRTLRVEPQTVQRRVSLAGVLAPRRHIGLLLETRGRVLALGAQELDPVEAGQVLAEIDPLLAKVAVERAQATLTRTRSQLALAQSNLRRRRSLAERDVASASALDDAENAATIAEASVREARAALDEARDQLAKKTVTAPFAGVLRALTVEVGEVVRDGQEIGELLDSASARLEIGLSDREIVAVRPGDPVAVTVEARPGEVFEGRILRVGAASAVDTKKFPIEVDVPNPDGRLLPGMIARAAFDLGAPTPMTLIPRESALDQFGLQFVYVLAPDADGNTTAQRRRVEVRDVPFRPGELEVTDGLAPGEEIAVTGVRQLSDGLAVRARERRLVSLPQLSVRQAVLVNLVFVGIVVAGLLAWARIPVDVFPDISFNAAEINTVWRGASADEVERLVTTKIEDEIQDVIGIKEIFSFSSAGLSRINIQWDETISKDAYEKAVNDLRAALDRVNDLPEDAEEPIHTELSVSETYNICMVALADVGGVGEFTLREVARKLEKRLERIPGIRKATPRGMRDRELRVFVDKDRLLQYDLTLSEVSDLIARNNQNMPAGTFTSAGDQEITVRGLGNFVSPESLAATVVKKNADGTHVRLGELATVESDFETRRIYGRYNRYPAVILGISKKAEADVIDLVAEVRSFIERERALLPPGVEARVTWDTSDYVDSRISLLRDNLLMGVFLVVFLLWFTVGFRNALLAILGIPFSFLTALVLFPVLDVTINSLSLVGFVMVSGMIVDDAIIILENIYRHVEMGKPLQRAVIDGAEEVMWPVTAAVATTCAAFLPMLFIPGTSGEFMEILPKTTILCLLGSLLEALVILPAHYIDFGSRHRASERQKSNRAGLFGAISRATVGVRIGVDARIDALRDGYVRAQAALLANRYLFLGLCLAAVWFAFGAARHVRVDLFPADFNQLFVSIETPTDYGVDQTDAVVRRLEQHVQGMAGELEDYSTYSGFGMTADMDPIDAPNRGVFFVSFPNTPENVEAPGRMLRRMREHVAQVGTGYGTGIENLVVTEPRNGPPIGKPVAVRIQSPDYDVAKQVAEEIKADLRGRPGVFNIEDNLPEGPRELQLTLDEHRASIHGVAFEQVGMALRAANDGIVPSTFKDPNSDEDVDIRVMLRESQRGSINDLLDVELRTPDGYLVKLGDVAQVGIDRGYQRLYHFDAQRSAVVYADVDGLQATSVSVNQELQRAFEDVPARYPGVSLVFGGEFQATNEAMTNVGNALLVALIAIYAILAAQFRSYAQPLVVMSVVFLAYIGVTLGMWLLDYAFSMYVLYAIVGLAGIVVNDSLVLIDFINQERRRGTGVAESVRAASEKRFRPIMLTTLTTIAGLAPMALGLQGKSVVFAPFAAAIVFGLGIASLLTLFVVPALYIALEDAGVALRRLRGREPEAPVLEGAAGG